MTEPNTKIGRYFAMGNPTEAALQVMLQRWRENATTSEYALEWGAALDFGAYLVQHYELFRKVEETLKTSHNSSDQLE
jgi:hypothetical protein